MVKLNTLSKSVKDKAIHFLKGLREPIVDDLGDYIPFMAYFKEREFCNEQIRSCANKVCTPVMPTEREDTLLGLIEHYRLTKNILSLRLAESYVEYLIRNFFHNGKICVPKAQYIEHCFTADRRRNLLENINKIFLKFFHDLGGRWVALPRNGIYIELLTDLYELTNEEKYLALARSMGDVWLKDATFSKKGLFPSFRLNPFGDSYAVISKDNTALINGFSSLYKATEDKIYKEAVQKWIDAVRNYCFEKSIWGKYYFQTGKRQELELYFASTVVDLLCDFFVMVQNESLLEFAKQIVEFWLDLQSQIGLFPMDTQSNLSYQDNMTDFCISLWRLYELSGDMRYREAFKKGVEGLFKYHTFNMKVDYRDGTAIESFKPKSNFVGLMLKPVILLQEGSIYSKETIAKLLRDR